MSFTLKLTLLASCLALGTGPIQAQITGDDLFRTGDSLRMLAQFDQARDVFAEADSAFLNIEDWRGVMRVGLSLSRMDLVMKDYLIAEDRILSLVAMATRENIGGLELASCYNILGAITGEQRNDFDVALDWHNKALAQLDTVTSTAARGTRARTIGTVGVCYLNMGDFQRALKQYAMAVDTLIALNGTAHPSVSIGYRSMANVFLMYAEYDTAIVLYKKALDIQLALLPAVHPLHLSVYRDLGDCYFDMGNLDQASDYYLLAQEMAIALFGSESYDAARFTHKMARVSLQHGDITTATQQLKIALVIAENVYGPESAQAEEILVDFANLFAQQQDYSGALETARRSLEINEKIRPYHTATAESHIVVGKHLIRNSEMDNGLKHFDQALVILEKSFSGTHPEIAKAWLETGKAHRQMDNGPEAHKALVNALDQLKGKNATAALHPIIIPIYTEMIKIPGQTREMRIEDVKNGMRSVDGLLDSYSSPGTQAYWLESISPFYHACLNAIHLLYLSQPSEELFLLGLEIAERGKSALLRRHLHAQEALVSAGLPENIFQLELSLKKDLRFYSALLSDPTTPQNQTKITHWQNRLREVRASYLNLQEQLSGDYPEYHSLKYGFRPFDLRDIRRNLNSSILCEFVEGDSSIHIFGLSAEKSLWNRITLDSSLLTDIAVVKNAVREPTSKPKSFIAHSFALYTSLIEPVREHLDDTTSSLIIVPDGQFHTLPFEILCTEHPKTSNWTNLPYLLLQTDLQYVHSLDGLIHPKNITHESSSYSGFAPSYVDDGIALTRSLYGDLPFAREEVISGHRIWNGQVFIDSAATKSAFLNHGLSSRILHLAMHTEINPNSPALSKLLFQDSDSSFALYTYEIYDLQLRNQSVILSACETGLGEYQRGEGILSLSRAFQYAGIPSIAMSLWKVSDQPTKIIITDYLQQLKFGSNKSSALRTAKIHYLTNADQIRAHPFYWAGIVHVGENSPIKSRIFFYYYLLAGIIFLILTVLIIRRNK